MPVVEILPTPSQLARLRAVRALIRALAERPERDFDEWRASIAAALSTVTFCCTADLTLRSAAAGWDAITDDLLLAALALADVRSRISPCANPGCHFLFRRRLPESEPGLVRDGGSAATG